MRLASASASVASRARDVAARAALTTAPDTEPASTRTSSLSEPSGEITTMEVPMDTVASETVPSSLPLMPPGTPTAPVPASATEDGPESTALPGCAPLETTSWTFVPTPASPLTPRSRPSPSSPEVSVLTLITESLLLAMPPLTSTAYPLLLLSPPR